MNIFFRHQHDACTAAQAPIPAPHRSINLKPEGFMDKYSAAQYEAATWELSFFRHCRCRGPGHTRGTCLADGGLDEVVQHAEVGCLTMPDILFCAALMHRCTACMLVSHPCFAGCHTACPWMQPCLNNTGAALHVRCHQAGHMFGLPCRHAGQALLFCCLPPCAAMLEQSWRCSAASCPRCLAADVLLNMVDGRCMETGSIPGSPYLRPAPRRGP